MFHLKKVIRPHKDVPWLTHHIKQIMKTHNKIYIQAKCNQNESDWATYRQVRNEVNNLMKESYHTYCKHLFDNSYSDNRKRFWSLIKSLWKDSCSIASLNIDGKCVIDPQVKAEALNNQFFTFFTNENNFVANPEPTYLPQIDLYFSTNEIENISSIRPVY